MNEIIPSKNFSRGKMIPAVNLTKKSTEKPQEGAAQALKFLRFEGHLSAGS